MCFRVIQITSLRFWLLPRILTSNCDSFHDVAATSSLFRVLLWGCHHFCAVPSASVWLSPFPCRPDFFRGYFRAFLAPFVMFQSLPNCSDCFWVVVITSTYYSHTFIHILIFDIYHLTLQHLWLQYLHMLAFNYKYINMHQYWIKNELPYVFPCHWDHFPTVLIASENSYKQLWLLPCRCGHIPAVPIPSEVATVLLWPLPSGCSHFFVSSMWLWTLPCGSYSFPGYLHTLCLVPCDWSHFQLLPCDCSYFHVVTMLPCGSNCFWGYIRNVVASSVGLQSLPCCFLVVAVTSVWFWLLPRLLLCLCGSFRVVAVTSVLLSCGCEHFCAIAKASEWFR